MYVVYLDWIVKVYLVFPINIDHCVRSIHFFSAIRDGNFSGLDVAERYLNDSILARNKSIPIAIIQQGFEPSSFIGFFNQWNYKLWNVSTDDFIDKL